MQRVFGPGKLGPDSKKRHDFLLVLREVDREEGVCTDRPLVLSILGFCGRAKMKIRFVQYI